MSSQAPPAGSWEQDANHCIAEENIKRAEEAAQLDKASPSRSSLHNWVSGADVETAWSSLHAAEAALVVILDAATIDARLPDLRAGVSATLSGDGRAGEYTKTLEQIEARKGAELTIEHRERIRVIKTAIDTTSDAAHSNIRSYRNWLLIVSAVVSLGLLAAALAHAHDSTFLFIPEGGSHGKQGADVAQLEAAGAIGGLLMALFALIRLTVYSGPVALPLWQALVRVPAGAAAGLVGAALMQSKVLGSIVPQPRSGLLGYTVLFGAAPEIVLRFLDGKVNAATAAARPKNDPLKDVPTQGDASPADGAPPTQTGKGNAAGNGA